MIGILLAHLVGDYLTQSDWMANEKTKRWWPAWVHAITYGLPFVLITRSVPALVVIGENTRANFRYGNETLIGCLPKTTATSIIPGAPHTWYAVKPAGARAVLAFISQH